MTATKRPFEPSVGRPLKEGTPLEGHISARVTKAQESKFKRLGGAEWARKQIDEAKEK